jgi:Na+-driven multidrug efflux pump
MNVGSVVFQSLGKAIPAFITAVVRPAAFLMPSVFILTHFLGLKGVWLAFPVTDILSALLVLVFLIPMVRQLQEMKKAQSRPASVTLLEEKTKA